MNTHRDALVVIEIPTGTEAFRQLKAAMVSKGTTLVRLAMDGGTFKVKRNEGGWTHPLGGATVRPLHPAPPADPFAQVAIFVVKFEIDGGEVQTARVAVSPGYSTTTDIPRILAVKHTGDAGRAANVRVIDMRQEVAHDR